MIYAIKDKELNGIFFEETEFNKALTVVPNAKTFKSENLSEVVNFINIVSKKVYAVKKGRIAGIYFSWDHCQKQTNGAQNALFKSFTLLQEAVEYLIADNLISNTTTNTEAPATVGAYAYVDGSYNAPIRTYGYGVVLFANGNEYEFKGSGNDFEMSIMRNVSGEILGAQCAIAEAIKLGEKEITIFYDYQGIECWATGEWKRNKRYTIEYYNFIQEARNKIKIKFKKVKAHSGVELNERVDKLAKSAVGI